jgi:hypothetical protein
MGNGGQVQRIFDEVGHVNADLPVSDQVHHLLDAGRVIEAVRLIANAYFGTDTSPASGEATGQVQAGGGEVAAGAATDVRTP